MKKNILSAAAVAVLGVALAPSAFAADGKITFKGQIEDTTCTVTGGAGTDGGLQNFTVTLPTVQRGALDAANDRAGDTQFQVIIGGSGQTGCANGTKLAYLKFEPTQSGGTVDATTGRLKNAAGTAAVVQVGLLNESKADINLNTNANADTDGKAIAGNTATLTYWAQYFAPATGVTAGSVDTSVMYSVAYK